MGSVKYKDAKLTRVKFRDLIPGVHMLFNSVNGEALELTEIIINKEGYRLMSDSILVDEVKGFMPIEYDTCLAA